MSPHLFDMLVPTTAKTHFQFCYDIINGIGFVKGWRLCLAPQRSEFYTHTNIYYFFLGGGVLSKIENAIRTVFITVRRGIE